MRGQPEQASEEGDRDGRCAAGGDAPGVDGGGEERPEHEASDNQWEHGT